LGNAAALEELEGTVRAMLADVRVAVRDWRPMLARLTEVTAALRETAPADRAEAAAESAAFLDWLAANHFTFLGCRRLAFVPGGGLVPDDESGLGLLADPSYTVMRDRDGNFTHWTTDMTEQRTAREPVLILKANRRATVHRGTHYDLVAVAEYDADGGVTGEHLFVGLFTSGAYNRSPDTIPLLREKIARVIQRAGYAPASHDGKALDNVLETFPRDELFQSTDDQLYENALGILQLVTRPRTRLFMREDRFGRFVSCMVFVPRDRYNTELRVRLGEILCEAVNGRVASWEPSFAMETMARVHFVVALTETDAPVYEVARIEKAVVEATRSWADRLCDALVERFGEHKGHRLHRRYGEAFPASYVESAPVAVALSDIQKLVPLSDETPLALHFYRRLEDGAEAVRFKIYSLGRSLALSACLPVLEHMGFRVLAEHPHKLMVDGVATWVHDFEMVSDTGVAVDLGALREKLEEGFAEIWAGRVDDDRMNRLVLLAGLDIRAVSGLRAYSRFLRQARIPYSIDYMEDALAEQPAIAADLVALFAARFDPAAEEGREERVAELTASIEVALDAVPSLDVDRILRRFLNALMATLRTNAFQQAEDGKPKPYLSFKFDSGKLDELPLPRPWREIFVYATWVEGVHLRGGPVARGGLRWSDRKEDYRTEILGLVKAQ
ncbi:MAG: NAD-glutamate dehydrogenase domain-containing protein, partial [Pseudomonadota bacterium]